jgi:hypothetical protein
VGKVALKYILKINDETLSGIAETILTEKHKRYFRYQK